jgi:hypothetical protein
MEESTGEVEEEVKKEVIEPEAKRLKIGEESQSRESLYLERLKLASFDALNELSGNRRDCPKCFQSRKYFCYDCYIPLNDDLSKVPRIQLPIDVTV